MCVVEIALHRVNRHVFAGLRGHLQALYLTGAMAGVKHRNAHTGHVPVAFQGGLARVAGGGHQNKGSLFPAQAALCLHQQARHELKRVILKGASRAVPQLQRIHAIVGPRQRGGPCAEARAIDLCGSPPQERRVIIGQKSAQHFRGQGGILPLGKQRFQVRRRNLCGHKQPAVL